MKHYNYSTMKKRKLIHRRIYRKFSVPVSETQVSSLIRTVRVVIRLEENKNRAQANDLFEIDGGSLKIITIYPIDPYFAQRTSDT